MMNTREWTNNFLANWPAKIESMEYEWICEECGTCYSSKKNETPPGVQWNDGHKCELVVLRDKNHKELVQAQAEYRELLDTMLPDDCNIHLGALQKKIERLKKLVQTNI